VKFNIHFSFPACGDCPDEWPSTSDSCWWEDDGMTVINSTWDCWRDTGVAKANRNRQQQSCCPTVPGFTYTCDNESSSPTYGMCSGALDPGPGPYCSTYDDDEDLCEDPDNWDKAYEYYESLPAEERIYCNPDDPRSSWIEQSSGCTYWYECGCTYVSGECQAFKDLNFDCGTNGVTTVGSCIYEAIFDDSMCSVTGFMEEVINYDWTGNPADRPLGCPVGPSRYKKPCVDVVKLSFFTWINLVIAVLVIITIYYFTTPKKKPR